MNLHVVPRNAIDFRELGTNALQVCAEVCNEQKFVTTLVCLLLSCAFCY